MKSRRSREPEQVVEEALKILVLRNPLFITFYHSPKNGDLDTVFKIDFLIILANRLSFSLQVKGNEFGVRRHYKKCPHIPALCVRKSHGPEKVANRIERLVLRMLENPHKIFTGQPINETPASK